MCEGKEGGPPGAHDDCVGARRSDRSPSARKGLGAVAQLRGCRVWGCRALGLCHSFRVGGPLGCKASGVQGFGVAGLEHPVPIHTLVHPPLLHTSTPPRQSTCSSSRAAESSVCSAASCLAAAASAARAATSRSAAPDARVATAVAAVRHASK
eukprot:63157-Chlamydomonas_euryale.AAC.1